MNLDELKSVVKAIVAQHKGVLAARKGQEGNAAAAQQAHFSSTANSMAWRAPENTSVRWKPLYEYRVG